MKDLEKTKEQLIEELVELRQRMGKWESEDNTESLSNIVLDLNYAQIFDVLPLPATLINDQGIVVNINQAFLNLARSHGRKISKEDRIGKHVASFTDSEEEETAFRGFIEELLKTGEEQHLPWEGKSKEGDLRFWNIHASVLKDTAGKTVGALIIREEITGQKQAEKARKASEERYRNLVEELPVGIAHTSLAGEVFYYNPHTQQMLGYTLEELKGLRTQDLYVDLADRDDLINNLKKKGEHSFEYRLRCKDGRVIWVRGTTRMVRNEEGDVSHLQGYLEDITMHKQATEVIKVNLALQRVRNEILLMDDEDDWGKVVHRLEQELHDLIDFSNCGINILDLKNDIQIDYFMKPEGLQCEQVRGIPSVLRRVQERGEPLYRKNRMEIDLWDNNRSRPEVNSVVDVPFPGGTLAINSVEEEAFSENDIWILSQFAQVVGEGGNRLKDLIKHKEMEWVLQLERDLVMKLSAPHDLKTALDSILDAALQIKGIDCGGIYLVDRETGTVDLATSKRLPSSFVSQVSRYEADSPQARVLMDGQPVYSRSSDVHMGSEEIYAAAGLRSLAIIPVHHGQQVVAALNLASFVYDEIPDTSRQVLETIASHIGELIAHVEMEERLHDSQQNLQVLFNSLDDFIFILDMRGTILNCNPVVSDRLGYPSGQLIGMNALELHPPELREKAQEIIAGMVAGQITECPVPLLTSDGMHIPVETKVTGGIWNGKDVLFGVSRDISEREELERERIRIERLRAVGELALGVSHNLNNILTGVLAPAQFLKMNADDPKIHKDADLIIASAEHARDVVHRLQQSVRIEQETLYSVSINEVVQQAVLISQPRWKDENERYEQAEWVVYRITDDYLLGTIHRTDNFRPDPSVKTGSADLSDYRRSGFDRGHLAPAAAMKWSSQAMSESFFMSNEPAKARIQPGDMEEARRSGQGHDHIRLIILCRRRGPHRSPAPHPTGEYDVASLRGPNPEVGSATSRGKMDLNLSGLEPFSYPTYCMPNRSASGGVSPMATVILSASSSPLAAV